MRGHESLLSVVLLALIAVFVGGDLVEDYQSGLTWHHFLLHVVMLALATTHGLVLWRRYLAQRQEALGLGRDLVAARADAERWRLEAGHAIRDFSVAIDRQLQRWELTEAEREIAVLLLKGLAHKEIAACRNTSERTVRQQALSLYRKAGLSGRNELAAFFLEDLLGAGAERPARRTEEVEAPPARLATGDATA